MSDDEDRDLTAADFTIITEADMRMLEFAATTPHDDIDYSMYYDEED